MEVRQSKASGILWIRHTENEGIRRIWELNEEAMLLSTKWKEGALATNWISKIIKLEHK